MDDLELLTETALVAGQLALSFFRTDPKQWKKDGGSPVSEADLAVDKLVHEHLMEARPDYGWLSEESARSPSAASGGLLFVVDPIDGTRGYLAGDERWAVSLAVVRDGRPILAALFAPALGRLLTARESDGAYQEEVALNGSDRPTLSAVQRGVPQRLAVSERQGLDGARLEGPHTWLRRQSFDKVSVAPGPSSPSLAWRFALVASGDIDAAIAKPNSNDWDIAACDLLVQEAGGLLTDQFGSPPIYDQPGWRHEILIAGNASLRHDLSSVISAESNAD